MADIMMMGKNPNFLGSWDLYDVPNQKIVVTIDDIHDEDVVNQGREERVTVCSFKEQCKPMILNLTNKKTLTKLYKTKDSAKLSGKKIEIGFEKVKAFGKISDALRISNVIPSAPHADIHCEECSKVITAYGGIDAVQLSQYTQKKYGKKLCSSCAAIKKQEEKLNENNEN